MWDILKHKETSGGEGYNYNHNCGDKSYKSADLYSNSSTYTH